MRGKERKWVGRWEREWEEREVLLVLMLRWDSSSKEEVRWTKGKIRRREKKEKGGNATEWVEREGEWKEDSTRGREYGGRSRAMGEAEQEERAKTQKKKKRRKETNEHSIVANRQTTARERKAHND
jgi:hypothetical protein